MSGHKPDRSPWDAYVIENRSNAIPGEYVLMHDGR